MALTPIKVWTLGEVLSAADLNAEFDNLYSNPMSLISPVTASLDMDGHTLVDAVYSHTVQTFADGDATPAVTGGSVFKTANTAPTTITFFDSGATGQVITVVIADAFTTFDFSSTNLRGNGGSDWGPTTGDMLTATFVNPYWYCNVTSQNDITLASSTAILATGSTTSRTLGSRASDYYNALNYDVTNAGVETGAAITTFLDTVEATGGTAYFPRGTYAYATSPNFYRTGVDIHCDEGCTFSHTGSGNACEILGDGGGTSYSTGQMYTNFSIAVNASSTNGLYTRSMSHSIFTNPIVDGASATGAGILIEGNVLCTWVNPRVTVNEGGFTSIPLYGMKITRRTVDNGVATTQTLITPILEGMTRTNGYGLYIDYGGATCVLGGSFESNWRGLAVTANSFGYNVFTQVYCEANTHGDVLLDSATLNTFNTVLLGSPNGLLLTGTTNRNVFTGGTIAYGTIDATASYNSFTDVLFVTSFIDNSTLGTNYLNCWLGGGTPVYNRSPATVVATASLPVAAAAMNGTILIEDGGAGDRNLIIYAGGQRFRIDGGANV